MDDDLPELTPVLPRQQLKWQYQPFLGPPGPDRLVSVWTATRVTPDFIGMCILSTRDQGTGEQLGPWEVALMFITAAHFAMFDNLDDDGEDA